MASIDSLKASDGTGAASVATIQNVRAPTATTLVVDTVQGINGKFHATMGTPHTFVDPVTSETITVISESTAVDFQGHVDGGNLEIDTIAPGFTDNGSAADDIVIIKPTTQWADEVADVLEVSHNDDGTLKANTVGTTQLVDGSVTPVKRSGGFAIGVLDISSSGTKVVDGLGFKPKLVEFTGLFSANSNSASGAMGAMTDSSQYAVAFNADSSNNRIRNSSTSAAYIAVSGSSSTPIVSVTRSSIDNDGFTVEVTGSSSNPVSYKAYA